LNFNILNFFKNKSNASIDKDNTVEKEDEISIEEKAQIKPHEIDSKNLLQQPTHPLLKTESSERKAADSLIVAALMGNSIMRFKAAGANAKRVNTQMSVPVELLTSTKSSFNETTERMKSLNENETLKTEQICLEELNVKQPDSNSETKNRLKQILINKINSANKSNTSNNKTNQNISNLSTTRSANSSKASKCMLTFLLFLFYFYLILKLNSSQIWTLKIKDQKDYLGEILNFI